MHVVDGAAALETHECTRFSEGGVLWINDATFTGISTEHDPQHAIFLTNLCIADGQAIEQLTCSIGLNHVSPPTCMENGILPKNRSQNEDIPFVTE